MAWKGKKEYDSFLAGKELSRKGAMLAQCYVCNGLSESGEDCNGISCPLYAYMPYNPRKVKTKRKALTPEQKRMARERFKKARLAKAVR